MKLIDIITIVTDTLKHTSKDLDKVIKIVAVVMNALQQQGYVDTASRGMDVESLDNDSIVLVNQIVEQVRHEAE